MEKRLGLLIKMFRRFNEKPEAFFLKARRLCKGLPGRPHDGPETTAQSGCNDRTIRPQRPHNPAPTTARFGLNDRTIRPQRPHDPAPTTARFGLNDRTIQPRRPHNAGRRRKKMIRAGRTPPGRSLIKERKRAKNLWINPSSNS